MTDHHGVREDEFEGRPELVKKRATAYAVDRLWRFIWLVIVAIALTIIVFDTIQGVAAREELLDCTQPQGQCFQDAQSRSSKIVARIVNQGSQDALVTRRTLVFAIVCAENLNHPTIDELDLCVERLLKQKEVQ